MGPCLTKREPQQVNSEFIAVILLSLFLFYLNIGPLHQSGTGDNELPFRASVLKLAYLIVSLAFSCTDAISVQVVYLYTHILGFMGISYHLFSFFFF